MTNILPTGGTPTPAITETNLVGGFDTSQIVDALLTPYELPEQNLQAQQSQVDANAQDYQAINADLTSLQAAAAALSLSSGWGARQAVSSSSGVATASAASGTPTGSVSFSVLQLAAANTLVSSGYVASTADVVDANPSLLLAKGGGQFGFATLAAGAGLNLGSHTIAVTQASQAASTTGTTDLRDQTSGIDVASGADLAVTVDGTGYTLDLAASPAGGYDGAGLLAAVQSAITAAGAGGVLQAGYDQSGNLVLATADQGSTQTLQVTGGSAASALGLDVMAGPATGADAVIDVDGQANTFSTVSSGAALTLESGQGGTVTATVAAPDAGDPFGGSLVSVGSIGANNVSTGNGSLANIVANVNASGTGITATAVQVADDQYVLQLSSGTTGTDGDLSVDMGAFASSSLGTLRTAVAGADAELQVGGANGYTLRSQTNTFTGMLPGLSITATSTSSAPVTVTVSPDGTAAAAQVQTLVKAANTVLADVQQYAGYDEDTKTAGPLMGSAALQTITNQVLSIVSSVEGTSTLGNSQNVGITLDNGTLDFDQGAFEQAYAANPTQVANMFTQGGSFAPSSPSYAGQVAFSYASSTTRSGTYDIDVTQSATQATDQGTVLAAGTVSAGEQLTITQGGTSVAYTTTAGESLSAIASGLNSALAGAGLAMSAQVVNGGQQLQMTTSAYGSAATFQVTSSDTGPGTTGLAGAAAGTPATFTGVDVAGTIGGLAATGRGQFLTAPSSDPTLDGLSVLVSVPGITSSTDLGQLTYVPGIAQSLGTLAYAMSNPVNGEVTTTIQGLQTQSKSLDNQISFYAGIVSQERSTLQAQYAKLEAQIGSLQNQSSALSSALSSLINFSTGTQGKSSS